MDLSKEIIETPSASQPPHMIQRFIDEMQKLIELTPLDKERREALAEAERALRASKEFDVALRVAAST